MLDAASDSVPAHHPVCLFLGAVIHLGLVAQQQGNGSIFIAEICSSRSSLDAASSLNRSSLNVVSSTLRSASAFSNREIDSSSLSNLLLIKKKVTSWMMTIMAMPAQSSNMAANSG